MYFFLSLSTLWDSFRPPQPFTLPRAYKDNNGRKKQPGLKHLPNWLRGAFRDRFIHRIIEDVCAGDKPWSNPALPSLQHELNRAYPTHQIRLHSDDAAVVPVSACHHDNENHQTHANSQTLRDLGVLRNQIGSEGLTAVIEYLPSQFTKRMLGSKDLRAKYIMTVLADPQCPFVWKYFRPGTIPLAGERGYYDEVISSYLMS